MATTSFHGRGGSVYLGTSAAVAAVIANARSWKFTIDKALDENNKFGDVWQTQLLGLMKWTGSIEGNTDLNDMIPWNAVVASNAIVELYMYTSGGLAHYYYGTVWPKLDITVDINGVSRYTLDFDGDGALTII